MTLCARAYAHARNRSGQIIESTPSRPRRYHLARIADAGSVPCSATTIPKKPVLPGLVFFLPVQSRLGGPAPDLHAQKAPARLASGPMAHQSWPGHSIPAPQAAAGSRPAPQSGRQCLAELPSIGLSVASARHAASSPSGLDAAWPSNLTPAANPRHGPGRSQGGMATPLPLLTNEP
jgi:hypothetical protein